MTKPCLPALRNFLTENGFTVTPIRYYGPGRILSGVGFDAAKGSNKIKIEPRGRKEYLVTLNKQTQWPESGFWCQHYSVKRDGFQPALTRHISKLKPDVCEFLNILQT